jgi:hypothetical protein
MFGVFSIEFLTAVKSSLCFLSNKVRVGRLGKCFNAFILRRIEGFVQETFELVEN